MQDTYQQSFLSQLKTCTKKGGVAMPMKNYYSTISKYYKTFGGPAPWVIKSTSAPKLIFSIPAIECGIFCRLHQDLPRRPPRLGVSGNPHGFFGGMQRSWNNAVRMAHSCGLSFTLADSMLRRLSFKTRSTSPRGTFNFSAISARLKP